MRRRCVERNRAVHRMLVDGVAVEYAGPDGAGAGTHGQVKLFDFDTPENNDWLAVNQFSVSEKASGKAHPDRRPDVVVFVNGLPLAAIELKNPADENATVWSAWQQLQTYQAQIPALFATNAALVVSDGVQARIGALGAGKEWFKPWRTITGREDAASKPGRVARSCWKACSSSAAFSTWYGYFIVLDDSRDGGGRETQGAVAEDEGGGKLIKKMAGYHQFHAVNVAVEETLRAAQRDWMGDSSGHVFRPETDGW